MQAPAWEASFWEKAKVLHHIEIYVSDIEQSFEFWSQLLEPLGYCADRFPGGFSLEHSSVPYITFVQIDDKFRSHPYHRKAVGLNHLAFFVEDRAGVDRLR